jgi:hypothetical protein
MKSIFKPCLAIGFLTLTAVASGTQAQQSKPLASIPIGSIPRVEANTPTIWGMSGMEMIRVNKSADGQTPIKRTLALDARTVEILSRTQAPPLRSSDVHVVTQNGREMIGVRGWLLVEVMRADAAAERVSTNTLAHRWAASIGKVLPQVAPTPNRFGA